MPESAQQWALIAHGGAKDVPEVQDEQNRQGMLKAAKIGSDILRNGGTALEAVVATINYLELDPAFNAGLYGCARNVEGNINLDAAIMDGATLDIGSVAHMQSVEHPISVAHALLRDPATLLVSKGANLFAREQGYEVIANPDPLPPEAKGCDTVGCVALDQHGFLAAGTSTAGLNGVRVGRVGDVPLPGCGFYADNKMGAMSASGDGEMIARTLLGIRYLHLKETMTANAAARTALDAVAKLHGEAGIIAIHPDGQICWDHNSSHFAVSIARHDRSPQAFLRKSEEA